MVNIKIKISCYQNTMFLEGSEYDIYHVEEGASRQVSEQSATCGVHIDSYSLVNIQLL